MIVDPNYDLKDGELTPWTNGEGFYKNCVFDDETGEIRGITEIEDLITKYCFNHTHHLNNACSELGYNLFEYELFHTDNLKSAAEAIYRHEIRRYRYHLSRRSKNPTKYLRFSKRERQLLKLLPEYLMANGMGEVLDES